MKLADVCLAAVALGIAGLLPAQNLSSVIGTVTDPTGAVIPGVSLTLKNLQTTSVRLTTSDVEGRYGFLQVQPGDYQISGKATGFSDVLVNGIRLLVNVPATVNIKFEKVGAVSEVIAISADAVQINTTDSSLGNAISGNVIVQIPLFARNIAALLSVQPGVTFFGNGDSRDGSVNGGKSDQANVTLDGVDVNDQQNRFAFTSILRVTPDSVQEFRSTTSNATADQGRSSGAQIALITKGGGNDIHGSLYEYHRNTVTSANNFFNNQSGVKRPALLIDVFGGSIGGPIKRNKLFYFFNAEGRRDRSAVNNLRTVPSELFRQGTVQYRNTAGGISVLTPADIKARVDPAGIGVNPASLQLLQSYPLPNDTSVGDGLNIVGYRFTHGRHAKQDTYITKFDYNLSDKNSFFARGNLQNDHTGGVPQFPGDPDRSVGLSNNKGFAAGWTSVLKPTLISTFRYGLTRQGAESTGIQSGPVVTFRNLDARFATTLGLARVVPTHHISQDFSWTKGAHDVRVGATLRWVEAKSANNATSWSDASTNVSWLRGTGSDLQAGAPGLNSTFRTAYGDAMVAVLGIVTQGNARYNYTIQGDVQPQGAAVKRRFRNEEYEWYIQDTWRVKRSVTITYGLRHSLMPPVYEADGVQTSATFSLGDWFNKRGGLADAGRSQKEAGRVEYVLHSDPRGRPLYDYHKKNIAPRLSVAYSPQGSGALSKFLFGGPGRTSIRAGWGMFYDLFGQGIIRTMDSTAFGLNTRLTNPSGQQTSLAAPRFTGFNNLPSALIRPAPKGGFPQFQPDNFAITNSIDDRIRPPYSQNLNFSIGREFGHGLFIQGAYVGRLSRRSIINRDLAMPTNITDPGSGMSYFEAATLLANHIAARTPTSQVGKIPFWENLWSTAATGTLTATQAIYNAYRPYGVDYTSGLADIDQFDDPVCSRLGCNAIFNSQFSALSAWSSVGGGNYHGMQWTVRKRFSEGLTLDFNYTWSKSTDVASAVERAGSFSGFVVNPWNISQRRAVSDYDVTQIWNATGIWQIPFGRGRHFGGGSSRLVDAVIGGWQIAPRWSQSTELPVSVGNGRNWPTNWNLTGYATPKGTPPIPQKNKNAAAVAGAPGPNLFSDPKAGLDAFGFTLPGQSGSRNTLRGDGSFVIDLGVGKTFQMPYNEKHKLQFRWESFNLTNAVRFDVNSLTLDLGNTGSFGKYSDTLGNPRQMQFVLRYEF